MIKGAVRVTYLFPTGFCIGLPPTGIVNMYTVLFAVKPIIY